MPTEPGIEAYRPRRAKDSATASIHTVATTSTFKLIRIRAIVIEVAFSESQDDAFANRRVSIGASGVPVGHTRPSLDRRGRNLLYNPKVLRCAPLTKNPNVPQQNSKTILTQISRQFPLL